VNEKESVASVSGITGKGESCLPVTLEKKPKPVMTEALKSLWKSKANCPNFF